MELNVDARASIPSASSLNETRRNNGGKKRHNGLLNVC